VTGILHGPLLKAIANASHAEVPELYKVLGNIETIYTKIPTVKKNPYHHLIHGPFQKPGLKACKSKSLYN
jgi:hypothetical protein